MELEPLVRGLASAGYHVSLHFTGAGWNCELLCGSSVMKGEHPRPRGFGATALNAIETAKAEIPTPKPKDDSRLVAGLPRY